MRKGFGPLLIVAGALFFAAPFLIARAPYESTMGLIQKIMYYHVPSWIGMYAAIAVCFVGSVLYLFQGSASADRYAASAAELAVLFGLMGVVTGPLWGRKAWGVWWQWEVRLTSALLLELIFIAYLIVRKYGGPGSEKLAAATALFGAAVAPFVYFSVNIWRTMHPKTSVVPTLPGSLGAPLAVTAFAYLLLFALLLTARVRLAERQAQLDEIYLALED